MTGPGAAFYCMSSEVYFLGAVGMINSLRLQGHEDPIYLLDLGLTAEQRQLLAPQAEIVAAPPETEPWLAKTVAPLAHPAETMVLIDADMIATRPLDELIAVAAEGKVVAFLNDVDRHVAEWGEVLDLGPIERRPYLCSGFVAIGREPGIEVLELLDDRQRRIDFEQSFFARNVAEYPLLYLDQDVLNAVLAARVEAERVVGLPLRMAPTPPFAQLRVVDEASLRCAYPDGTQPFVVHQFLSPKPWQGPTYDGVYSRLLRRLLCGDGLAIRVPRRAVPLRLRRGGLAYAERRRVDLREQLRWRFGGFVRERLGRS